MNVKSVLITGSSGMIGTALAERLRADGYDVYGADIVSNRWSKWIDERTTLVDLRAENDVRRLPSDVDLIVHLGAHARVHRLVRNPDLAKENVDMTFNLLDYARENDVQRVLFASSREVYGNTDRIVYDEAATNSDRSESPYTASKVSGEAMVNAFSECYGMTTSIVRLSNVYGRYDASDRVVPTFIARSRNGHDLTVYGAEKVLDFTYLDDCVDGIHRLIDRFSTARGTTFNIASGQGSTLIELAETIDEYTPGESDIALADARTGEMNQYVADISRAERMLDYRPRHSLCEGVERTVEWYLERPELLEQIDGPG